jgi:hypothetical protein
MSLVFFGYFFVECHRETSRRKPRGSSVVRVSPESQVSDSPAGNRHLIHLEKQMADFMTHRRSVVVDDYSRVTPAEPVIRP